MKRYSFPFVNSFLFTDTLNLPVSDVTVASISPSSAVISWSALANATDYDVFVNPVLQTVYNTAANGSGITISHKPGSTIATVSGLVSGREYYVSVWANALVPSLRGDTTFIWTSLLVDEGISEPLNPKSNGKTPANVAVRS